jgi:pyruvate kinase
VVLTTRRVKGSGAVIPVETKWLPKEVKRGDTILLDDGRVRLEVRKTTGPDVTARVLVGGILRDHRGINLPDTLLSIPILTKKDKEDLAFGQRIGVDFVALSYVRSAKDIEQARTHLKRLGTPVIAKIEKPQAVANLEEIASAADGVMIARGDLGVEMPLERLPLIQKDAVRLVNRLGRVVIVATEMLESMVVNARPTRAEVSDVANAIFDGADAVMLSSETAIGKYPVLAAATMSRVVQQAERREIQLAHPFERSREISTGVAAAAVAAASQLRIKVLVAYTESGYTARLISEFRPKARILALTPHPEVVRRMALYWGVEGRLVGRVESTDAMIRQVQRICREERVCRPGATVVIVAGVPLNVPGNTNLMTVRRM